jgi:hypothetical protein
MLVEVTEHNPLRDHAFFEEEAKHLERPCSSWVEMDIDRGPRLGAGSPGRADHLALPVGDRLAGADLADERRAYPRPGDSLPQLAEYDLHEVVNRGAFHPIGV